MPSNKGHLVASKKLLIAAITALILAVSGIAVAEQIENPETDDSGADTTFSFGYDEENHVLAVNQGPNDGLYVCEFEGGLLTAQYGEVNDEDTLTIDALEDEEGPKEFEPRLQHELAEGLEEASEPIAYAGADGECRVNGIVVAGPNGQINHGQFMKAFKQLIDLRGHGCLNRYLAQSDLGKTDTTKIATQNVDPSHEVGESGELSFLTFEADCVHGKKADNPSADKGPDDKGKGKPNKDKGAAPGNSGNAPGKNK